MPDRVNETGRDGYLIKAAGTCCNWIVRGSARLAKRLVADDRAGSSERGQTPGFISSDYVAAVRAEWRRG